MSRHYFQFGRFEQVSWGTLLFAGLFLGALALVYLIYRRDTRQLSPRKQLLLLTLRLAVWTLLAIMFFEPQLHQEDEVTRSSRVVVALDTSLSMTLPADQQSSGKTSTRWDATRQSLEKSHLFDKLAPTQEIAVHNIGRAANLVELLPRGRDTTSPPKNHDAWQSLVPADDETRIGDSLESILRENRTSPLSGIVLFSDGQSNAGTGIEAVIKLAQTAKVPIYAVGLGTDKSPMNLRVTDLRIPARVFKGDELHGQAFVQAVGLPGEKIPIEILLQPADNATPPILLESQEIILPADESPVPIIFHHLPEVVGSWQIIVRTPARTNELRNEDNSARAHFEVIDQKTKVLLIAGGPTREYRFLRNLLFRDGSVELAVHLQSAASSAAQEADQKLVTLPMTRDALFRFDVIVAIDADWSVIPAETQSLLDEWVSKQSGGMILIAGPVNTPRLARSKPSLGVLDLYPVVLKEIFSSDLDASRFAQAWPVTFTRDGELATYLRLDEDAALSKQKWEQFTGVYWCYSRASLKPAAVALATFSDPQSQSPEGAIPLIATQFYGSGRVLYLGTGEIWRLRQLGEAYYDKFWIRVIREMSQSRLLRGSARAMFLVDGDRFPLGSSLTVRAQLLGNDYQPISASVVPLSIIQPNGSSETTELKKSANQPGLFDATISLRTPGEYRLQLLAPDTSELVERRIMVDVPGREFADLRMNRELLENITRETGGKLLTLDQLEQLPKLLPDRTESTVVPGAVQPLWDNAWMLIAIVILLGAEWLLRKWSYLA